MSQQDRAAFFGAQFRLRTFLLLREMRWLTMAVKFTSVKCPECGANLPIEEGREKIFCSYCGTPIIMTDENEYTYRHVDEAEVKRAETEQLVHLKELEMEEKDRKRKVKAIAYSIVGVVVVIGMILMLLGKSLLGMDIILVACIPMLILDF